ncbi:MAG: phosphate regulon transcriptional regulator PhoB [Sphingomonadales bacterium]|jgi:two-component system phosphate regulon response regulator PhoB|nr:phosphate regulon transcriptional regulator PhoB [Sphingomonadales bacterium]MBK9002889.1 phosphate regulon transcriptional regulator PhoB [Sphingomonadales bacterium]MBK9268137.1 phosphate regulon transcriptional regulator PhoB [Sphingomonadales bacterium]MBP6435427.1 phosphate regulon transcriptional regulator PhoB [Sphingorhabdus sp.]
MTPKILIVEDEPALAELLSWTFESAGFEVEQTVDGEEALLIAEEFHPDIIILDWMIEQLPGIEVCRRLRKGKETAAIPIIMLTARGEEEDRIRGLETGADDYVTKPFSPRELRARVEAVLRRTRPAVTGSTLVVGDLELDPVAVRVKRDGAQIALGPTEFRLLRHFMERPGRAQSRSQLLDAVWGHDSDIELRTVDVHIRRLRSAIELAGKDDPIRTIRSVGYALDG